MIENNIKDHRTGNVIPYRISAYSAISLDRDSFCVYYNPDFLLVDSLLSAYLELESIESQQFYTIKNTIILSMFKLTHLIDHGPILENGVVVDNCKYFFEFEYDYKTKYVAYVDTVEDYNKVLQIIRNPLNMYFKGVVINNPRDLFKILFPGN